MKRLFTTLLATVALSSPLFAEKPTAPQSVELDPARLEAASELIDTLEIKEAMEAAFGNMSGFTDQMIEQQGLKGKQAKKAKEAAAKAMETSMEAVMELDWVTTFAEIYAEVFTVKELKDLNDFYEGPVGQKYIKKQPELQQATMVKMQGMMGEMMEKVQAKMQEAVQEEE